jgi:hypothetical protein
MPPAMWEEIHSNLVGIALARKAIRKAYGSALANRSAC